jgi:cytochrome c biogenesis protein
MYTPFSVVSNNTRGQEEGLFMDKKGYNIRSNWAYKKLNSVKTTLLILGLMAVVMVLGTIFPQEMSPGRYINSWGQELYERYNSLGLLHIFKSPLFLTLTYIFSLNIVVCTYERYRAMIAKKKLKKESMGKVFVHKGKTEETTTGFSYGDMTGRIHNIIGQKGFKIEKRHASDGLSQLIVTKGVPYLLISILFHLSIFLCVIGFIQTYLDNYEGYVTIYPEKIEEIDTVGEETRFFGSLKYFKDGLKKYLGFDLDGYAFSKEGLIKIGMTKFETEYTWFNEGYYPKDWKSDIILYDQFNEEVAKKKIEVNDPIYYEGFAFYQAAYEQSCDLHIENGGTTIKASPNEPFTIEGQEGRFMIGTIRTGKLFQRFGDTSTDIVPNVKVYYYPPAEPAKEGEVPKKPKREEIGNLEINKENTIKGITMYFDNFKEATVVSYRRDAGVPILWFASILLMVAMAIRVYLPYYKLQVQIEPTEDGKSKVIVGGNCLGLTADLQKQLETILQACA